MSPLVWNADETLLFAAQYGESSVWNTTTWDAVYKGPPCGFVTLDPTEQYVMFGSFGTEGGFEDRLLSTVTWTLLKKFWYPDPSNTRSFRPNQASLQVLRLRDQEVTIYDMSIYEAVPSSSSPIAGKPFTLTIRGAYLQPKASLVRLVRLMSSSLLEANCAQYPFSVTSTSNHDYV